MRNPWTSWFAHASAPHYRVVRSRLDALDGKNAETVIAQTADSIEGITQSKDFMLVQYSNGISGRVVQYDLTIGAIREVKLPTGGSVDVNCPDAHSNRSLVEVTGWVSPPVRYEVDADTGSVRKSTLSSNTSSAMTSANSGKSAR